MDPNVETLMADSRSKLEQLASLDAADPKGPALISHVVLNVVEMFLRQWAASTAANNAGKTGGI